MAGPDPYAAFSSPAGGAPGGADPYAGIASPAAPMQPSRRDVSATGNPVGDFIAGLGQGAGERLFPVLNAPNRLFGRIAEPIARGLGLNPPPSMTGAGADAQAAAQQKEFQPIDATTSTAGRMGRAGGDAAAMGAGMALTLPMVGPAALAPGAVPEAVAPTVARALTGAPASIGGMIGQGESNVLAGAGGQSAKELSGGDPWAEMIGQQVGGASTSFFPSSLAAKALGMVGSPVSKLATAAATKFIPESAGYEARQAERKAFTGRGVGDNGAPLEAPSGADYSNPATPAPAKPSIADRIADWATTQRNVNAHQDIQKRISEIEQRPEVGANLNRARELAQDIPDLKLTYAEQTGYSPLILAQKEMEAKMGGDELVGRQNTYDRNQKAIGDFADSRIAPTQGNPDTATGNAARGITESRELSAASDAAGSYDKLRNASRALPNVPQQESGAKIRQGYQEAQQAANAQVGQNRQAVVDAAGGRTLPAQDLHNGIQADLEGLGTTLTDPSIPASVKKLLGRTETPGAAPEPKAGLNVIMDSKPPGPPNYDIEGLLQAREDTNVALRRAQSAMDLPGKQSADTLMAVRNRLDGELDRMEQAAGPGSDIAAKMKAYREHYANDYAPNHGQGLGLDIRSKDANRANALSDQDVTQRVLANDADTAAQNLRVNPTGPGRVGTVQANLDDLRRSAVDRKTNMLKEGAVQQWIDKNQDRLAADPGLKRLVEGKDPQKLFDALNASHNDMQAAKDTEIAKMFGSSTKASPRSDTSNITDAINDPEKMQAIKAEAVKDPELDAALKRAVWERAVANPTEMVKDPKGALNIAFGDNPQHLRDLKTISDAVGATAQTGRAKGAATDFKPPNSVFNDVTGSSAASILNKLWGLNTGRSNKVYTALDIGARALNNFTSKDYERALKTAIYNPEVAKLMAAGIKAGRLAPPGQRMLSQYLLAAPLASATREDKQ